MTVTEKTERTTVRPAVSTRRELLIRAALGAGGMALAVDLPIGVSAATPAVHPSKKTLTIGAKDFSENQIVAYMYLYLLQIANIPVNGDIKKNLASGIATPALVKGDIDIFPEYTGTGLEAILKQKASHNAKAYYDAVSAGYQKKFKLTWLDMYPMNDTQGFATTRAFSEKTGIKTIADMVKHASEVRLIVATEYLGRADGLPGVKRVYGNFTPKEIVQIAGAGSLRYAALLQGRGDIVEAFTTDAALAGNNLVVLGDPKGYAPPDNLAPVVRDDALAAYPNLKTVLNKLAPKITNAAITKLNYQADIQGKDPKDVARTFLQDQGLIKK
ncbi:MAG TPA: glycine betaine ABC transporter substrate-binding protein [Chloroflexota bacterium]|nr:glycine betaine ABC transporter substrate-binding protein [Chloroflexota bacterium]